MEIWIRNDCETDEIDEQRLHRRAGKALAASGLEDAELSVWLCDDATIQDFNHQYLDHDSPTNVISFSQREGAFGDVDPEMLGDVVISFETARREADHAGQPLGDYVAYLLVHGILHLLGYDHEGKQSHRAPEMEARQKELYRLILHET